LVVPAKSGDPVFQSASDQVVLDTPLVSVIAHAEGEPPPVLGARFVVLLPAL